MKHKKLIISVCILFCLSAFVGCGDLSDSYSDSESDNSLDSTKLTFTDDFDSDGKYESFILKGNLKYYNKNSADYFAELFYYDGFEYQQISERDSYLCEGEIQNFGERRVLILSSSYAVNNDCHFFSVIDGKPVEFESFHGGRFEFISGGAFTSSDNGYYEYTPVRSFTLKYSDTDASLHSGGRTLKKYYFFWDEEKEKIFEYGGKEIDISDLERFDYIDSILNFIDESGGVIDNVYYRGCDVININYTVGDSCYYVSFEIYPNLRRISNPVFGDGRYKPAVEEDIAVYPDNLTW